MNRFYTGQLPDVPIAQLFLKWFQAPPANGGFSKRNTVRSARTCPQSAKSGVVVARELDIAIVSYQIRFQDMRLTKCEAEFDFANNTAVH
jgi:hypothetical protein